MGRARRTLVLARPLPPNLDLNLGDRTHRWELGVWARYGENDALRYRHWRVWETPPVSRHALYVELYGLLQRTPQEERQMALHSLRRWAGVLPAPRPFRQTLSREDVRALDREPLVELAAHTITHPVLAALPLEIQSAQIGQSRALIEGLTGAAVMSFSYPFGRADDHTPQTVVLVRAARFSCACANVPGPITPGTNRFRLPRTYVEEWEGDALAATLETQLAG